MNQRENPKQKIRNGANFDSLFLRGNQASEMRESDFVRQLVNF